MLATNNPIGCIFAGFFLAYLTESGSFMQTVGYAPEIVKVISSVIIYCSALSLLVSEYIRKKKLDYMAGITDDPNVKRLGKGGKE